MAEKDNQKNSQDNPKKRIPEKVLFTWKAPERPFKKRDREFWVKIVAASSLFGFILFIIEGAMPVILMIAVLFLFYILTTVPPQEIEYKITNKGIKVADNTNYWEGLVRFWFSRKLNSELLVLQTFNIPGRLELIINTKDKDKIKDLISDYIPEEEAPPTGMDKASNWFSQKLLGE